MIIPNLAREKLQTSSSLTPEQVKNLTMIATDDLEQAHEAWRRAVNREMERYDPTAKKS